MSSDSSTKSSNNSTSSSSPNQAPTTGIADSRSITDLTVFGVAASASAALLSRTGTVRRVSAPLQRKEKGSNSSNEDGEVLSQPTNSTKSNNSPDQVPIKERLRKSLDSTYRHSLESISEYKTRHSFSTTTSFTSRTTSSIDSSSTDSPDYSSRHVPEISTKEEPKMSPSSSYLSWIESVNSEYFGSAMSSTQEVQDVDNKVGEWNNFWLNYNSARSKYVSSSYQAFGCSTKAAEDLSDAKSNCSSGRGGQKEFLDGLRTSALVGSGVTLTFDEIHESIRCAQRLTDILTNALRRSELDLESVNNDSYYSDTISRHNSCVPDPGYTRERSVSCVVDPQQASQKQKLLLQSQPQSSSTSCINAILSANVTDMLRRVISKSRRDVSNLSDVARPLTRSSFSEWSTK